MTGAGTVTRFNQISEEELPNEPVTVTATAGGVPVTLGMVTTDGEGYLDQALAITTAALARAGRRRAEAVQGHHQQAGLELGQTFP